MNRIWNWSQISAVFAAAGLIGPIIRWMAWPPSAIERHSPWLGQLITDLTSLLWPTQALAVVEANVGSHVAAVLAAAANVAVFALAGAGISLLVRSARGLAVAYLVVALIVVFVAVASLGRTYTAASITSLGIALLVYAVPFYLSARRLQ